MQGIHICYPSSSPSSSLIYCNLLLRLCCCLNHLPIGLFLPFFQSFHRPHRRIPISLARCARGEASRISAKGSVLILVDKHSNRQAHLQRLRHGGDFPTRAVSFFWLWWIISSRSTFTPPRHSDKEVLLLDEPDVLGLQVLRGIVQLEIKSPHELWHQLRDLQQADVLAYAGP